jgi:hypothetical protein
MRNVILYFPWGAGGNLIRNIISLDPTFEFYDDNVYQLDLATANERYQWMLSYYQKPTTSADWLPREWSIRLIHKNKYYTNNKIAYWNPDFRLIYDTHGEAEEIAHIQENGCCLCFDRYRIGIGERPEQISNERLLDYQQIIIVPRDVELITEIYNSKNPTLKQLKHIADADTRYQQAEDRIVNQTKNIIKFYNELTASGKQVLQYYAEDLFQSETVDDIVAQLGANISKEYTKTLHSQWLQSTMNVYYNYYNREMKI